MSDRRTLHRSAAFIIVILTFFLTPSVRAQSSAGIIGVVTDTSGAVLPGVTVTARSPALQVPSVVSVTDAKGEYRLTPLPPGLYSVSVELSGFQTIRRENVRLTL